MICYFVIRVVIKWEMKNAALSEKIEYPRKKITERSKIDTSNTQIRNRLLSRLATVTSIKSGGVKLVLWTQTRENVPRKLGCSHRHEHTLVIWIFNVNAVLEAHRIFYVHTSTVVIFINVLIRAPLVFNMYNIYTLNYYVLMKYAVFSSSIANTSLQKQV